jgi:hypothetical protein
MESVYQTETGWVLVCKRGRGFVFQHAACRYDVSVIVITYRGQKFLKQASDTEM